MKVYSMTGQCMEIAKKFKHLITKVLQHKIIPSEGRFFDRIIRAVHSNIEFGSSLKKYQSSVTTTVLSFHNHPSPFTRPSTPNRNKANAATVKKRLKSVSSYIRKLSHKN